MLQHVLSEPWRLVYADAGSGKTSPFCLARLQQPAACPVLQSESRGQAAAKAAAKAAATPLGSALLLLLLLLLPPPDRANSN